MINSPVSEPVRAAMRALFLALGEPDRSPLTEIPESNSEPPSIYGLHPVFDLAETFGPGDAGYTGSHPRRGGHLSLPCFDESGDVGVLETTFHKGETTVEYVRYPREPAQVYAALYKLLEQSEVRH
jgi:hypothetical protein